MWTLDSLINITYPDLAYYANQGISNREVEICNQYFQERTILTSKNQDVDDINSKLLKSFPGEAMSYYSIDEAIIEEGIDNVANGYPIEYLNSITYSGLPLHNLEVKIGCPLMVLQNLDSEHRLCNGTRCLLTKCT